MSTDSNTSDPAIAGRDITVEDALRDVNIGFPESRSYEYEFEEVFSRRAADAEERWIRLLGLKGHFKHKSLWSWMLMVVIVGMVIFQSVLIWNVGTKRLDYTGYDWLLPILMVQYLPQIVTLAVFAVRSFFGDAK